MYTISEYGNMYMNEARMNAYAAALRDAVTPNSVVLDIGAGTGIFALLACRYGARRVYAIEPDDAINLARESAAANGYSDRLTCIQSLSTKVALPERADVIISDMGGMLPLFEQHIPAIIDARDRFLAPGGALIAQAGPSAGRHHRSAGSLPQADPAMEREPVRPGSECRLAFGRQHMEFAPSEASETPDATVNPGRSRLQNDCRQRYGW